MDYGYKDGKIIVKGAYHEAACYDMSNEKIAVTTDGTGGLLSYRIANRAGDCLSTFCGLSLAVDGAPVDPYTEKVVEMIGRTVIVRLPEVGVTIETFLAKDVNGVFYRVSTEHALSLTFNCRDAKRDADATGTTFVKGARFLFSSSVKGDWISANDAFYVENGSDLSLLLTFEGDEDAHKRSFRDFDDLEKSAREEIKGISIPASAETEEEKALYLAAYFTSLENHKTVRDFRAFAAGINYLYPLRTYFRDGYFTTLPLYGTHPEYVRDQILTLAGGIMTDGTCPSAVKSDFTAFWGDHYDSPCFFVMMVYDYVTHTGDTSLLQERVHGDSILVTVDKVLSKVSEKSDKTGLLYKDGDYNKRDWADEVNRNGYVTYVEALYARALYCASTLFASVDPGKSASYGAAFESVKTAINDLLFDEEKGYYVNYKTADFTEDNLSIDTVFTLLFGIADDKRAARVLDNMERLLETRNNTAQKGGDFGVMCVYPPYKARAAASHKSMRLYDYHNGANWCYLSAMYAYACYLYGRDYRYPLTSCFSYNVARGNYTPVEYFSPCCKTGSALQGWSGAIAFVYDNIDKPSFFTGQK